MEKAQDNINNLLSLWKLAGEKSGFYKEQNGISVSCVHNSGWPNRIWSTEELDEETVQHIKTTELGMHCTIKLPLFSNGDTSKASMLLRNGFKLLSAQTGMDLDLDRDICQMDNPLIRLHRVTSENQVQLWSGLYEKAFGYSISTETISLLVKDVHFYTVFYRDEAAGTVILYLTGKTAGIHGLGIHPSLRGQGIARGVMLQLLKNAKDKGASKASLQASDMAVNLYKSLGFIKRFTMQNFQIQ